MSNYALPALRSARPKNPTISDAFRTQFQVLYALMLHDIKSRFFGNGLGYVVTILWPSVHMAVIMLIFVVGKRPVPYGQSAALYAATGILPYIAWNYISRFVLLGLVMNKSFLQYPIVKPLDMMLARLALEMVSIFIVTVGLITILVICQVPVMPINLGQAALGLLSAVFLGIGFAIFNGAIVMIFPLWNIGYVLILIVFWVTCGLAINPEALPAQLGYYISWNPLMHCVEWIRSAYYYDFPAHLLDKSYLLWVSAGSLALGLIGERVLRRFFY